MGTENAIRHLEPKIQNTFGYLATDKVKKNHYKQHTAYKISIKFKSNKIQFLEQSSCVFSWLNKRHDNIKMHSKTVKKTSISIRLRVNKRITVRNRPKALTVVTKIRSSKHY